ncbi:MAG TPA: prolyl oligopeptidase family serine peptidase [Vicinamibacteria bacterium]|nr:prolyl oligopeptidase family serine peptidase [Vicinamibacteria bacterium]
MTFATHKFDYPKTRKVEQVDDYHGTKVEDPYRWLEDDHADETKVWVEAQNKVTFAYLESLPQREPLKKRLTELWNYPRYGAPFKKGGRYFFFKNDGLQNQSVLYKQSSLAAEPEMLLDPNQLSDDGTVALSMLELSEDGKWLAYGVATAGSDWQEFRVRAVDSGEDEPDHLRFIKFSGASWTHDGRGFFYSRFPEPEENESQGGINRNQKVYYHRLGTDQSEDRLVYERPDQPEWGFNVVVSDSGNYAIFNVSHGTDERNRVYTMDLGDPIEPKLDAEVVRLLDDFDASYEFVGNDGSVLYFRTNLDAPRYRVVAIDTTKPDREHWKELIAESEDLLENVEIINNRFVVLYLRDAASRMAIHEKDGRFAKTVELPTVGSVSSMTGEREDEEMFYAFESFLYPDTIYRYEFQTAETSVFRSPEIAFDGGGFETKQVFYRSKDGTRVPMFLTYKRGLELNGENPTYLYAYGGFNISLTPSFSMSNLVWLEMGGVYAQANLRGGGEYGEKWHQGGTFDNKQNVFDDFIAAAEFLVDQEYTKPEKLAIGGGSNGGLLVGAVLNQRPALFGAALPAVGVMDMLRFQKFTIGWAWVSDYGSSEKRDQFPALLAYSPYHNLRPSAYFPATLVTTADHDDRVVPGHSFKYAARLQEIHGDEPRPMLIRIQTQAGHGAGKPTSMVIEEQADRWAFVMENLGMKWPVDP